MQLDHIALNIINQTEVTNFYKDVLGMVILDNFILGEDLSKQFFRIASDTEVILMKKDNLILELFVQKNPSFRGYCHICLRMNNRQSLIDKAKEKSYECIVRERENSDQVFINDKSGNTFEIKNL